MMVRHITQVNFQQNFADTANQSYGSTDSGYRKSSEKNHSKTKTRNSNLTKMSNEIDKERNPKMKSKKMKKEKRT
jgi:hypothetical protein